MYCDIFQSLLLSYINLFSCVVEKNRACSRNVGKDIFKCKEKSVYFFCMIHSLSCCLSTIFFFIPKRLSYYIHFTLINLYT